MEIFLDLTEIEMSALYNRAKTLIITPVGELEEHFLLLQKCKKDVSVLDKGEKIGEMIITGKIYYKKIEEISKQELQKAGFKARQKKEWAEKIKNYTGNKVAFIPCKTWYNNCEKLDSIYISHAKASLWQIADNKVWLLNQKLRRIKQINDQYYVESCIVWEEDNTSLEWDIRSLNHTLCARLLIDDTDISLDDNTWITKNAKNKRYLDKVLCILEQN